MVVMVHLAFQFRQLPLRVLFARESSLTSALLMQAATPSLLMQVATARFNFPAAAAAAPSLAAAAAAHVTCDNW